VQVCAWLFACGNESQKAIAQIIIGAALPHDCSMRKNKLKFPRKNTLKYHQSIAQMLWLSRRTLSAKNIASHCNDDLNVV